MNQLKTLTATVGNIKIGSGYPIAVQTMCNTHTYDEDATVAQCVRMHEAGADIIRITVPGLQDVPHIKAIRERLRYSFFVRDCYRCSTFRRESENQSR